MRYIFLSAAIAGSLLAAPALSWAQSAPAAPPAGLTVRPPAADLQQTSPEPVPGPTIFGLPLDVAAPVASPYCNCGYDDVEGQPDRGQESLIAHGPGATD